jgi:hypothetical protein
MLAFHGDANAISVPANRLRKRRRPERGGRKRSQVRAVGIGHTMGMGRANSRISRSGFSD